MADRPHRGKQQWLAVASPEECFPYCAAGAPCRQQDRHVGEGERIVAGLMQNAGGKGVEEGRARPDRKDLRPGVHAPPCSRHLRRQRLFTTVSPRAIARSEEHTSELPSLMRISYAVFCLKTKKQQQH